MTMKKAKNRPLRFYFSDEKGRHEITLSRKFFSVRTEFVEVLKLLADSKKYGTRLSLRDMRRVENLPSGCRQKLIACGLLEATAKEKAAKVPTIAELLDRYKATRVGQSEWSEKRDRRLFNYLTEYFGPNKRIDQITREEASGMRKYLMVDRKAGKGPLEEASASKAIQEIKTVFTFAVDCEFIRCSPFVKVKCGKKINTDRQYKVSYEEIEAAIRACGDRVELAGALAFARYAGLRIPSEIRDLKFADFHEVDGQIGLFDVPQSGKTGFRRVPMFDELRPHFEALRSAAKPGQVYVFEKYRKSRNLGKLIKDHMARADLKPWEKFFINLRSSCQTDKEALGWSRSVMDAVFGNSERIRIQHYLQPMPDVDYAALGRVVGAGPKVSVKSSDKAGFFDEFEGDFPTFDEALQEMFEELGMSPADRQQA